MGGGILKPATAIFLYRRPGLVRELLEAVAPHRPDRIWLVADGPRNIAEEAACREARAAAEGGVSWPCEVHRVYAGENLGLRRRIETGLDEIFAREDAAILLEEDCHPTEDFFPFCGEMLARYRYDERIAGVGGNCFLPVQAPCRSSYFYSRFLHIWGWATWRRTWTSYNRFRWQWPAEGIRKYFPQSAPDEIRYWDKVFFRVVSGEIDTWDYRFASHLWSRGRCAVVPAQNLVRNRGFGPAATNTRDESVEVGIEREARLRPPFLGPTSFGMDPVLDRMIFENHFLRTEGRKNLLQKLQIQWDRFFVSRRPL